jgi:hypothetical protein
MASPSSEVLLLSFFFKWRKLPQWSTTTLRDGIEASTLAHRHSCEGFVWRQTHACTTIHLSNTLKKMRIRSYRNNRLNYIHLSHDIYLQIKAEAQGWQERKASRK